MLVSCHYRCGKHLTGLEGRKVCVYVCVCMCACMPVVGVVGMHLHMCKPEADIRYIYLDHFLPSVCSETVTHQIKMWWFE